MLFRKIKPACELVAAVCTSAPVQKLCWGNLEVPQSVNFMHAAPAGNYLHKNALDFSLQ